MPPLIWIDGQCSDKASARVSVFDHGLLYGDGVFERIRVYNRRIFRLTQHLDRLYASAKGVWIDVPLSKDAMTRLVEEAVRKSGLEDAYIRLLVTRGVGDLGLDPRKCPKPSIICIVDTIALWPAGRDARRRDRAGAGGDLRGGRSPSEPLRPLYGGRDVPHRYGRRDRRRHQAGRPGDRLGGARTGDEGALQAVPGPGHS